MDVIMDGLMIAGALFAGVYCWVLAGRVRALKSLEGGLGGGIVQLTRQIELARATLDEARAASRESRQDLGQLTARADAAAAQLRLLLAAIERAAPVAPAFAPVVAPIVAPAPAAPALRVDVAPVPQEAAAELSGRTFGPGGVLAARRREPGAGPRLVPPAEPGPETPADPAEAAALPKPRQMPPLDGPLRRRAAPATVEPPAPASEAELIARLTALAAGGDR